MKDLFQQHILEKTQQALAILDSQKLDCLYIESGFPENYYLDDQPMLFKSNPHFLYFCPDDGQGHILKIEAGQAKPKLYFYQPNDFWHEVSSLTDSFWQDSFDIHVFNESQKIWPEIANKGRRMAVISPNPGHAVEQGCDPASNAVIQQLNWYRSSKTAYEIECIREANKRAATGHKKAKALFLEGASEIAIFKEFMNQTGAREADLPYNSIVAFDENASILHYQTPKQKTPHATFLIDAGARYKGYCSDITRTHVNDNAHPVFAALLTSLDLIQKDLCQEVAVGVEYVELQRKAFSKIADLLIETKVAFGSAEELVAKNIPFTFYPHGLGHPIGLQVHDVGGKQLNPQGDICQQPSDFPFLRTLRTIKENDVVTIEPGLYFIPMLLENLKVDPHCNKLLNWKLVEELLPFGGIRIEDNVVARSAGPENLTRQFLS